jgi:hypothetical protein
MGRCPESGNGGDSTGCESRQEEAPAQPRGAGAHQRGDEEAVGGGEEGQSGLKSAASQKAAPAANWA